MNKMHKLLVIALATCAISLGRAAENEAVKKDLAQLQGEWAMVSASSGGQPMQDEIVKVTKRVCKGDETTVTMGEQVLLKAKITLDPSKNPKTIDYDMTEGLTKGKKQLGIYEVNGDTFKACFSAPGAERPKEIKEGAGLTYSEWKRKKSEGAQAEKK